MVERPVSRRLAPSRTIATKHRALHGSPGGGTQEEEVAPERQDQPALTDAQAAELEAAAIDYGMDVLAEVHDAAELERALKLKTPLLGINNRNLKTLEVDLATTEALAAGVPTDRIMVCESGLYSRADLDRMAAVGAKCFLIGESLMREADVAAATRALLTPEMAA